MFHQYMLAIHHIWYNYLWGCDENWWDSVSRSVTLVKLTHSRAQLECFLECAAGSPFVLCAAYMHLYCASFAFRYHYLLFTLQMMHQLFALDKEEKMYIHKKGVMKKMGVYYYNECRGKCIYTFFSFMYKLQLLPGYCVSGIASG